MKETELLYEVAWNLIPGVGAMRFYRIKEEFGSLEAAWNASAQKLIPLLGEKTYAIKQECSLKKAEEEICRCEEIGIKIICRDKSPDYPEMLREITDAPPIIYCRGQIKYEDRLAIGIVGTRKPTALGIMHATEISMVLAQRGLTIVSGMARGIDSAAHRGALKIHKRTIAVLGCGVNVCYPRENLALIEEIADNGAVISEFPLDMPPMAGNFPARNRIISGLSRGVVVVEATDDSGSLITAGFALEQGREVFAMPGNIDSEVSKGPHKLIRQGAKLIENPNDILEELRIPFLADVSSSDCRPNLVNSEEIAVYDCLSREPLHVDHITRLSKLGSAQVNAALMQLELKEIVKAFPGQLYLKVK